MGGGWDLGVGGAVGGGEMGLVWEGWGRKGVEGCGAWDGRVGAWDWGFGGGWEDGLFREMGFWVFGVVGEWILIARDRMLARL